MGKKIVVIIGVLAVAVVFLRYSAHKTYAVAQAVVAKADLPAYTVLKEDMVEVVSMPRLDIQQDTYEVRRISDIKLLNGAITVVSIPKGGQITQSSLLKKDDAKVLAGDYREGSRQHYLEGLKHFHNGDNKKAYEEWGIAKILDPSNADAEAGLKRIDERLPKTVQAVTDRGSLPISINLMSHQFVKPLHLARSIRPVLAQSVCNGSPSAKQMPDR
ncbi:MAG: SAF domain-containing protein [Elusimicrobia bacterium]|nr:SAF domain-containing protein [Elusimicrobiota bacterium]